MATNISDRVSWESYKGEEFIFIDYSNLNDREVFSVLMLAKKEMNKVVGKKIKMLTDLRDMEISYTTHQTVMKVTEEDMSKIEKAALINNIESNKVFINDFLETNGLLSITFLDKASALEFLMSEN